MFVDMGAKGFLVSRSEGEDNQEMYQCSLPRNSKVINTNSAMGIHILYVCPHQWFCLRASFEGKRHGFWWA